MQKNSLFFLILYIAYVPDNVSSNLFLLRVWAKIYFVQKILKSICAHSKNRIGKRRGESATLGNLNVIGIVFKICAHIFFFLR